MNRTRVARLHDADHARDAERAVSPLDHTHRRLVRVTLRPELGKEREAHIGRIEPVAFEQPAHADRITARLQRDMRQPEAVLRVTRERPLREIRKSIIERAHAAIADVLEEGRFVEEPEDERRVSRGESPDQETLRLAYEHGRSYAFTQATKTTVFVAGYWVGPRRNRGTRLFPSRKNGD